MPYIQRLSVIMERCGQCSWMNASTSGRWTQRQEPCGAPTRAIPSGVNAAAFSPDGGIFASTSDNDIIKPRDLVARASHRTLRGHSSLAFSPAGSLLASVSADNTIRLGDPVTGASRGTLRGHSDWVRGVAFSPDGSLLASASDDTTIRLWDPAAGGP